jgi:hypothetical protein
MAYSKIKNIILGIIDLVGVCSVEEMILAVEEHNRRRFKTAGVPCTGCGIGQYWSDGIERPCSGVRRNQSIQPHREFEEFSGRGIHPVFQTDLQDVRIVPGPVYDRSVKIELRSITALKASVVGPYGRVGRRVIAAADKQ